ncbi:hypothetical protein ABTD78_23825, partial [Acinetobacter baumannii]
DSYQNIRQWKNYEKLISQYQFIIYERPGFAIENKLNSSIDVVKAPMLDISATQIRENIKTGKSICYLVPAVVIDEIEKGK